MRRVSKKSALAAMTERLPISFVCGTLNTMLCTINGLEGMIDAGNWSLVNRQRELYLDFKNWIASQKEFQTNNALAQLDKAFTEAGWENQGLRWTKEDTSDADEPEQVFVVEFKNKARSKWGIV